MALYAMSPSKVAIAGHFQDIQMTHILMMSELVAQLMENAGKSAH